MLKFAHTSFNTPFSQEPKTPTVEHSEEILKSITELEQKLWEQFGVNKQFNRKSFIQELINHSSTPRNADLEDFRNNLSQYFELQYEYSMFNSTFGLQKDQLAIYEAKVQSVKDDQIRKNNWKNFWSRTYRWGLGLVFIVLAYSCVDWANRWSKNDTNKKTPFIIKMPLKEHLPKFPDIE